MENRLEMISVKEKIINAIYHLWEDEFKMKKVQLKSAVPCVSAIDCFQFKNLFIRLCTFQQKDIGRVYCVEAADKSEAVNNAFEDAWLYYESDGIENIISEMKKDLENDK